MSPRRVLLFGFFALAPLLGAEPSFVRDVLPMLDAACLNCHGSDDDREAGLDLEQFSDEASALAHRSIWKKVHEKLESHQMPPPKRPVQPTPVQRAAALTWIEGILALPDPHLGARDPGKPVLRRLNRLEYNNTLRDLFGFDRDIFPFTERQPIRKDYFNPALRHMPDQLVVGMIEYGDKYPVVLPLAGVPGDGRAEHGYGNRGDMLNLSGLLLEAYMAVTADLVRSDRLAATSFYREFVAAPADPAPAERRRVARSRLEPFLERAFRRPVAEDEAERFLGFYDAAVVRGETFEQGMVAMLPPVLLSPQFLYRSERVDMTLPRVRALEGHEVASRLSYFLWSSMPDDELRMAAATGGLLKTEGLEAQVRRMMRDPRIRELSESFAVQWLRLDQLFTAKPDRELFPGFYSGPQGKTTLHGPALVEPVLLFETILLEDRSILDLVDADFTYLNNGLRKLYGLDPIALSPEEQAARDALPKNERNALNRRDAMTWRRTPVEDRHRGGVITMAGPLIVTSLPTRTSPVKRGAWILETIANRPPDEPKIAFTLEPQKAEVVANLSVRQRFEAHRSNAACYSCHVRLDPPGFALEAFSPIGTWRTDDNGVVVDASGEWNGRPFDGPAGFKAALLADPAEFVRGFIEHLLSYALGRKLEHYDMAHVAAIQKQVTERGYRFSAVIESIATSYPFRFTRNVPDGDDPARLAASAQP